MTPEAIKAGPAQTRPNQPKFVVEASDFDEFMADVIRVIKESGVGTIDIVEAKKGGGKYGRFQYDLEGYDKELALKAGIPLGVSVQVIWHKLVDEASYAAESERRKASEAATIENLKARLARLQGSATQGNASQPTK